MEFSRVRAHSFLSPEQLRQLEWIKEIDPVKVALRHGGWLAGGVVRQILVGNLDDYFGVESMGDIDVFFPDSHAANAAIIELGSFGRRSFGGGAHEISTRVNDTRMVKIQIVDRSDLTSPTIEELLSGFDFNNCKVGVDGEDIIYSGDFWELEKQKLSRISRGNTPFRGSRLLKYLKPRDLVGITEDSAPHLTAWLCSAARGEFPDGSHQRESMIKHAVQGLTSRGVVRKEDLIFFIGKWTETTGTTSRYEHLVEEVDWALDRIGSYKGELSAV